MAQMLSFSFFAALLFGSFGLIAIMLRDNGAEIFAALGLEPSSAITPLPARPARRVVARRVVRTAAFSSRVARRAAA